MRLYILTTTGAFVQGPGNLNPARPQSIKFATQEPLEVQYLDAATTQPARLPVGRMPYLGVKPAGEYDAPFVVVSPYLSRPDTDAGFYTATLNCNTTQFAAALGDVAGSTAVEADAVALMGEVVYAVDSSGNLARSQTLTLTGQNRVVTVSEGVPTDATPPYPPAADVAAAVATAARLADGTPRHVTADRLTADHTGWKVGDLVDDTGTIHTYLVRDADHLGYTVGYLDFGLTPRPGILLTLGGNTTGFLSLVAAVNNASGDHDYSVVWPDGSVTFAASSSALSYSGPYEAGQTILVVPSPSTPIYMFALYGNPDFAGCDVSLFPGLSELSVGSTSISVLDLTGLALVTLDVSSSLLTSLALAGHATLGQVIADDCPLTSVDLTGLAALSVFSASSGNLSEALIDSIINQVAANSTVTGGTLSLDGGTNAAPTAASAAALANLIGRGWIVYTN